MCISKPMIIGINGNRTFRQSRFSKKKIRDVLAKFFLPKRPPPCFCRNVFRRNVRYSYQVPLGYVPISSSALRPRGAAFIPILLSEVEQEQRPSGNGDREAIVVELVLATVRASVHTPHMPHIMIFPGNDIFIIDSVIDT